MTKAELINLIAEQEEISAAKADSILNCIGNIASDTLKNGDEMLLPGIGKLKPKASAARTGRNPKTGEPVQISAKTAVKFAIAKALKDAVA